MTTQARRLLRFTFSLLLAITITVLPISESTRFALAEASAEVMSEDLAENALAGINTDTNKSIDEMPATEAGGKEKSTSSAKQVTTSAKDNALNDPEPPDSKSEKQAAGSMSDTSSEPSSSTEASTTNAEEPNSQDKKEPSSTLKPDAGTETNTKATEVLSPAQSQAELALAKKQRQKRSLASALETNDFTYELQGDSLTITGYTGTKKEVTIPEELMVNGQNYAVTAIADEAFSAIKTNNVLTKITLPNSLKTIGARAFIHNELTELTLPDAVTCIGNDAFRYNQIANLTISNSSQLQIIGSTAFAHNQLSQVSLPSNLIDLGTHAFSDNGRYVVLEGESSALKTDLETCAFGAIYKPVTLWIKPVDKDTKAQIAEIFSLHSDLTKEQPVQELLFVGNQVVIRPTAQGKYVALQQTVNLSADFVENNSEANPLVVEYSQTNGKITFSGLERLEIEQGAELDLRKGVKATDGLGNDITSRIKIKPETLDTSKKAQYYVTYTVSDDQGNTLSQERQVVIGLAAMKIEIGKGWLMEDFSYDGQTLTGLSDLGKQKAKTNFELVLPDFNPTSPTREKLTKIGEMAFGATERTPRSELTHFTSVVMPDSYEEIEGGAFQHYNSYLSTLKEVKLSENMRKIGDSAFAYQKLQKLSLPKLVTEIGESAFTENDIAELDLANVEAIEKNAFELNSLTKLHLPASLQYIGEAAFKANSLETVTYAENFQLHRINKEVFANNHLTKLELAPHIADIGEAAFANNAFSELIIPASVKKIEFGAFKSNDELKNVTFNEGLEEIGSHIFDNCGALHFAKLVLPKSIKKIDRVAFRDNKIDELHLQSGLEELGDAAFMGTGLNKITFDTPNLTKIPNSCFTSTEDNKYPQHIKELILPDSVTEIGDSAFEAVNLEKLTLPKNLQILGKKAFANNKLKKLVMPENMTEISGEEVFSNNELEELVLPKKIQKIEGALFNNNRLSEIKFPESLIQLSGAVFAQNNLTKVVLPDSLNSLGGDVFAYNNINEVKLSKNIKYIAGFAHNKLTKVEIPASVSEILNNAFANNYLNEIKIADGSQLYAINSSAFANNQLSEINLPTTMQKIDSTAFAENPGWSKMPHMVLINIRDENGKPVKNPNLEQVSASYVINPSVVIVRHLLKDSHPEQEIAPTENIVLAIGEEKEIAPIKSEIYTATSSKQTVKGSQDEQTIKIYYTKQAKYQNSNYTIKLQNRQSSSDEPLAAEHATGLNEWTNCEGNLLLTVTASANDALLEDAYISVDFTTTSYANYIQNVELPNANDYNSPIKSYIYENGRLIINLNKVGAGSIATIPFNVKCSDRTPDGLIIDLSKAVQLKQKDIYVATASARIGGEVKNTLSAKLLFQAFNEVKNTYTDPEYEKKLTIENRQFDQDGYLLPKEDDSVFYKISASTEGRSDKVELKMNLPEYQGKDTNGEVKTLKAKFVPEENPNWELKSTSEGEKLVFSLKYARSQYINFADLFSKATLILHYPGAKKNEEIQLWGNVTFNIPTDDLAMYDGNSQDKFAQQKPYEHPEQTAYQAGAFEVKFAAPENEPETDLGTLSLNLRNSANYGTADKLLFYNRMPHDITYYQNNQERKWSDIAQRINSKSPHDENAFLDVENERTQEFIWSAQIHTYEKEFKELSLLVNELDTRMYLAGVIASDDVKFIKLQAYSESKQQGTLLLERTISNGKYLLPAEVAKQTKSLRLTITHWQKKEVTENKQVDFAILSKLHETQTKLYDYNDDDKNHFKLKATAKLKVSDAESRETDDYERIALIPDENLLNIKKSINGKQQYGPAEPISYALGLEIAGRTGQIYQNLEIADKLPQEVEFDNLTFSPGFQSACQNLKYELTKEDEQQTIKITAKQFDARLFISAKQHKYALQAITLNCHTSPLLGTDNWINNIATLKADGIAETEDSASFSSFVAKSLQIVNTVKAEATGGAFALYPQEVQSGAKFTYRMEVVNPFDEDMPEGPTSANDGLQLVNVLPYHGDKRLVPDQAGIFRARGTNLARKTQERASEIPRAVLTGPVTALGTTDISNYEIFYSLSEANSTFAGKDIKTYTADTSLWQTADAIQAANKWSEVTAIYIKQKVAKKLTSKSMIQFAVPMQAPTYANYELDGRQIVSSFAMLTSSVGEFAEGNNAIVRLKSPRASLLIQKIGLSYEKGLNNPTENPLANAKFRLWQIHRPDKDGANNYRSIDKYKVLAQPLPQSETKTATIIHTANGGKAEFLDLKLETDYLLEEVEAPDGYKIKQKFYEIKSTDFEQTTKIMRLKITNEAIYRPAKVEPIYGEVSLTKVDKNHNPLPTTLFKLTVSHKNEANGQTQTEEFTAVSDNNGLVTFRGIPVYGEKGNDCVLTEVQAHGSLQPIQPLKFRLTMTKGQANVNLGEIVNDKAQLRVYKLALTGFAEQNIAVEKLNLNHGTALPEVELTLADEAGTEIKRLKTDANGSVLFTDLETDKTYQIIEKTAPQGFKPQTAIKFQIDAQGKLTIEGKDTLNNYLAFPNKPEKLTNRIDIMKASQGHALAGVEFGLYQIDAQGQASLVAKQTTDANGKASFIDFGVKKEADGNYKYTAGTYELREEKTATGHLNNFVPLTIQTSETEPLYRQLSIENPKLSLQIIKQDARSKRPLAGAKFGLYAGKDTSQAPLEEVTSDKQGLAKFTYAQFEEGQIYTVKELNAPAGYLTDTNVKHINFAYLKKNPTGQGQISLKWDNEPLDTQIQVLKLGDDTLTPLANVGFKLLDPQGTEADREIFTNEHGYATFRGLTANKEYELVESKALVGYSQIPHQKVTTQANKRVPIKLINKLTTGYLQILKVNAAGTGLQGAKFKLEKKVDTAWEQVAEKQSTANGLIDFGKLTANEYRLTEVTAPTNYVLDPEPYSLKLVTQASGLSQYEISRKDKKIGILQGYLKIVNKAETPTAKDIKVTAKKVWQGGAEPRPTIYFQLERQAGNTQANNWTKVAGLKELANGTTSVEFTVPDRDQTGALYTYRVKEVDANGNDFVPENYTKVENGLTVSNTYQAPAPPPAPETINISVKKEWLNDAEHLDKRPNKVVIKLKQNGVETDKQLTLDANNNWQSSFTNLPQEVNGQSVAYTIEELAVPEYSTTISGSAEQGFIVRNTLNLKPTPSEPTPTDSQPVPTETTPTPTVTAPTPTEGPTPPIIVPYVPSTTEPNDPDCCRLPKYKVMKTGESQNRTYNGLLFLSLLLIASVVIYQKYKDEQAK